MAVRRTREYEADRGGAEISGEPLALASALAKIANAHDTTVNIAAERNPAMAHLYISNPLRGAGTDNLFSTHPATENRIAQLQKIAAELGETSYSQPPHAEFASSPDNPGWRVPPFSAQDDTPRRGPWG